MSFRNGSEARASALDRWALVDDSSAATEAAHVGFLGSFERKVDPDGLLEPAERRVRAERAMRAHMIRLAQASAEKRRRR